MIVTTNTPFSDWPQVFPSPRLCKAMLDHPDGPGTHPETGTESFRFRRTIASRQKNAGRSRAGAEVVEEPPSASR